MLERLGEALKMPEGLRTEPLPAPAPRTPAAPQMREAPEAGQVSEEPALPILHVDRVIEAYQQQLQNPELSEEAKATVRRQMIKALDAMVQQTQGVLEQRRDLPEETAEKVNQAMQKAEEERQKLQQQLQAAE
jgi:hypothetical protein